MYAGVDGAVMFSSRTRTITLSGFYQGKLVKSADDLFGLENKLHIRQNYPIMITTFFQAGTTQKDLLRMLSQILCHCW